MSNSAAHSQLVKDILIVVSALGLAWENRTGSGWVGQFAGKDNAGTVVLKGARPIRFGLPGSTDIILLVKRRAVVIEVKTGGGRLQQNQSDFAKAAVAAGAIHIVARSVTDVTDALALEGLV